MHLGIAEGLKSFDKFKKEYPGVNHDAIWKVATYLDDLSKNRIGDLYIFIYPDIQNLSEAMQVTPKDLLDSLLFLSATFNERIYPAEIFQNPRNGEFYILSDDEKSDIKNEDLIYDRTHPEDFQFKNPKDKIRHAFVVKMASQKKYELQRHRVY